MKKIIASLIILFAIINISTANNIKKDITNNNSQTISVVKMEETKEVSCTVTVYCCGVEESSTATGETIKEACDKAYDQVME